MLISERQGWHGEGTLWSIWTVGLAVWISAPALLAQEKPVEKCVFEGIARNALTQIPVPQVSIRLVPRAGEVGYLGTSNNAGSFHFEGIEAGDYVLTVDRTGYADGPVLVDKSGRPISKLHLAPGQTVSETELWLTPDGGIAGRVVGPDGERLAGARVILIARKWQRGKRIYLQSSSEDTNAEGEYHFPRVAPGRYFVYVRRPLQGPLALPILEAPGKQEMRIAGRYHPDSPELDGAAPIVVRAGEDVSGIDIRLPLVPAFHLKGKAASKPPSDTTTVVLTRRTNDQTLDWDANSASVGKDGSFDIASVTPGSYFLYSLQSPQNDLHSPKIPVTMTAKEAAGLLVPAPNRFEWRGRIRVEGGATSEAMLVTIFCEGSDADFNLRRGRTQPRADGTFFIQELAPDRYSIRVSNWTGRDKGLYLKSVLINGIDNHRAEIDMTGGPAQDVELILSKGAGTAEGTLQWAGEDSNHPPTVETPADVTVVVVPEGLPSGDTFPLTAHLDQDGHFSVTSLAPGHYRAFALTNYDQGLWQNAGFLAQIAGRGVPFELAEKATARIEVKLLQASEVRQREDGIQ